MPDSHWKAAMDVTIYHNPRCSTSRNTLEIIRAAGIEPAIIEYLQQPPSHALLRAMAGAAGIPVRALLRSKEAVYAELGLDNPALDDDALVDAMLAHPVLIERPLVVSGKGVRLCRPAELVREIL
ncbi:MAG: arsenate reductase (glutaredoxin) [Massilia sp.]|jgi:arsenate reductase